MSEAFDDELRQAPRPHYVSQFRFSPDEQLEHELARFYTIEGRTRHLGRHGLFLYSNEAFPPTKRGAYNPVDSSGHLSPKFSEISRTLRERGLKHRDLARRLQLLRLPEHAPGVSIRLDVILDEMTARALMGTVKLNPDRSVGVHLDIMRQDLTNRDEYLAACKSLYEKLLDDESRLGIDAIDLVDRHV